MHADELCEWLLKQDAQVVLQWFHEVLEGSRQVPERFNWLGLAEVSADLAYHREGKSSSPPDKGWAYVSVLVHNYIIDEAKEHGRFISQNFAPDAREHSRFSFEERLMRLRARFIINFGSVPGDTLLDGEYLVRWFFQELHFSVEEVPQKISRWRELSRGERWELNRMRRKLVLLRLLVEYQRLQPDEELSRWLDLSFSSSEGK